IRDVYDNSIIICNMENFDPMGIHTGESIVIAPSQTLSDKDHQMLRDAAIKIVREIGIVGSCNVQFAVNQETGDYTVIEINPRLSRSSALASKATGYPIARVATKIALGYSIHEIKNAITGTTAAFEPALDYCVLKIPKWPFEKFLNADRRIGTQMKSTGETMAIGRTFEEALLKGIRGLETKLPEKIKPEDHLMPPTDLRVFAIFESIRKSVSIDELHKLTKINKWFLERLKYLVDLETEIKSFSQTLSRELLLKAKRAGFSDSQIAKLKNSKEDEIRSLRKKLGVFPTYKIVDSCAGEFEAKTPYYYSTYEDENEAIGLNGQKVLVIGSGPIRIGQGIEFDYCCCHAAFALKELGIKSIMMNNNPETVSTDFDTSDRLYFEPLTFEDVMNIIENEKPMGVIVQFGGQTSINLAERLHKEGVKILGTQVEGIDIAEDRGLFRDLCNKLKILQPKNGTATNEKDALSIAKEIGYPIVVRPSYVIAGRGMQIIYSDDDLKKFIGEAVGVSEKKPVLIDKYLDNAIECEVDAISDGKQLLIGGIMEHIEYAGVHSGDANICIPSLNLDSATKNKIEEYTKKIADALGVIGMINIQYAVKGKDVYILEANTRASRTVPFLSKAISVPLAKIATMVSVGKPLSLTVPKSFHHYAVKGVVFPFLKIKGADIALGPEMKSTGETMGIGKSFETAYFKALLSSGFNIPKRAGTVGALISLRDEDKEQAFSLGQLLKELGFLVFATPGKIGLVINTPKKGSNYQTDGFKIRRMSIEKGITCITNVRTAMEFLKALKTVKEENIEVMELEEYE
ncbi:carbamoyl-phosphate synthase large subunit, partial [Candidatus Micrarchaeota archaeon]|nr:carbamoyl-phosphate synthase large subunit [Candidatus Micrarchaeota archaeon]